MANLVEHFRLLGVDDPEGWAHSQEQEGIDQLARATVLRKLADIVKAAPAHWRAQADHGTDAVREAAGRIAAGNATEADIDLVLQSTLHDMMFDVLSYFDGATEADVNPGDVQVGMFRRTEDFEAGAELAPLHDSWRDIAGTILGERVVAR